MCFEVSWGFIVKWKTQGGSEYEIKQILSFCVGGGSETGRGMSSNRAPLVTLGA